MYRKISYLNYFPKIHPNIQLKTESNIIGRVTIDQGAEISSYAVLRADGENITLEKNVFIGPRSTVHIAHDSMSARICEGSSIGSFSLVHACYIGKNVVMGDLSVAMDGSRVGEGAVVAAGSLIPPGKEIHPYTLVSGSPAKTLRKLNYNEVKKFHQELRNKKKLKNNSLVLRRLSKDNYSQIPFLYMDNLVNRPKGDQNISSAAYIAPGALINGNVNIGDRSSIWFSCLVSTKEKGKIEIGKGSNVQDNTFIDSKDESILVGDRVTIGHNVRIGICEIGDDCLLGMGCILDDNVVVESGGVIAARSHVKSGSRIRSGEIYAGSPAKFFRKKTIKEKNLFDLGQTIYEQYVIDYMEI